MKANELRIGNWVNYLNEHNKTEVRGVTLKDVYSDGDWNPIDQYQPIPLTEEWLLKFGFIRQGGRKMWVKDKLCIDLKELPNIRGQFIEGWYIGLKDLGNVLFHSFMKVEHVHQLQNLHYALTGEELQADETKKKVKE